MNWYCITCYRCRGQFMDSTPGECHCVWCGAPSVGMRGDVRHEATPVPMPPEVREAAAASVARFAAAAAAVGLQPLPRRAPPPPAPAQRPAAGAGETGLPESGERPICQWRLRSSTTGKRYTTRHKLTETCARGMDPEAQPVETPAGLRGGGDAGTEKHPSSRPEPRPPAGVTVPPPEGTLAGWRNGEQHQWSRDPGRGRRYR